MTKKVVVSFLLMMFMFFGLVKANIYEVGNFAGWTSTGQVDYKRWSASKHFQVGDILLFEFDPKFDNVVRVTKEDFQACNASSPFGTPSTGKEWFSLDVEGHVYFICSVPGHCKAGQNVEIVVHSAAPTTSPAASPPAILAPAPLSPHSSPDSAPSNGSVLHFPSFCLSLVLLLFSMFLVACCY
ncbi:mavicyanin-like [Nicotiana tabacum]|uniref:Mavicyanin-like n=2 Tax=Nicotiana TaxID=4085 RepID=A0AC58SAX7_TOBAC|nr:PREDICTED: mavicyanin-like [Nicotiana sylvestris]